MEQREGAAERQTGIYLSGLGGRKPVVPVGAEKLERAARKKLSREAFAYVAGGAGGESTVRENRAAFERWRITPKMLCDVSERDTSVKLFGRRLPTPLLIAPVGVLELAHKEADVAGSRAAADLGIPMIFSDQASKPMEECAEAMEECVEAMGDARGAPVVPTLLEQVRRVGRELCPAGRAVRLRSHRGYTGYHHARLADPGPRPRLPAVPAG